jgi:hypothetical protein
VLSLFGPRAACLLARAGKYVLKHCPTIEIDVEFSVSRNEADDTIRQISRPFLDYSHIDETLPRSYGPD